MFSHQAMQEIAAGPGMIMLDGGVFSSLEGGSAFDYGVFSCSNPAAVVGRSAAPMTGYTSAMPTAGFNMQHTAAVIPGTSQASYGP